MKQSDYKSKRFHVQARRMFSKESWTKWMESDDYDIAVKQAKKAEAVGFEAKIVDRGIEQC